MYERPRILPAGDKAIVVEFGDEISEQCNEKVLNLAHSLKAQNMGGIVSIIPTYRSVLIKYDPIKISAEKLLEYVAQGEAAKAEEHYMPRVMEIPVAYGGEFGPDIEFVAQYHNMTQEEVIDIHTGGIYRIYMLGFTMGFAYLGGMPETIATPRLEQPRTEIKAGSVGIAGSQTGIYPLDSPGGWENGPYSWKPGTTSNLCG